MKKIKNKIDHDVLDIVYKRHLENIYDYQDLKKIEIPCLEHEIDYLIEICSYNDFKFKYFKLNNQTDYYLFRIYQDSTTSSKITINYLEDVKNDDFIYHEVEACDFTTEISKYCKNNGLKIRKLYKDVKREWVRNSKIDVEYVPTFFGYFILKDGDEYYEMYKMMNY